MNNFKIHNDRNTKKRMFQRMKMQIPNESQSVTGIEEAMYFTIIISLRPHINVPFLIGKMKIVRVLYALI